LFRFKLCIKHYGNLPHQVCVREEDGLPEYRDYRVGGSYNLYLTLAPDSTPEHVNLEALAKWINCDFIKNNFNQLKININSIMTHYT